MKTDNIQVNDQLVSPFGNIGVVHEIRKDGIIMFRVGDDNPTPLTFYSNNWIHNTHWRLLKPPTIAEKKAKELLISKGYKVKL